MSGTYFDNLISGKFEFGDISSIASHKIAVQDTKDRLVRNDKQIVLFTLQLKNDWFHAYGKIMI